MRSSEALTAIRVQCEAGACGALLEVQIPHESESVVLVQCGSCQRLLEVCVPKPAGQAAAAGAAETPAYKQPADDVAQPKQHERSAIGSLHSSITAEWTGNQHTPQGQHAGHPSAGQAALPAAQGHPCVTNHGNPHQQIHHQIPQIHDPQSPRYQTHNAIGVALHASAAAHATPGFLPPAPPSSSDMTPGYGDAGTMPVLNLSQPHTLGFGMQQQHQQEHQQAHMQVHTSSFASLFDDEPMFSDSMLHSANNPAASMIGPQNSAAGPGNAVEGAQQEAQTGGAGFGGESMTSLLLGGEMDEATAKHIEELLRQTVASQQLPAGPAAAATAAAMKKKVDGGAAGSGPGTPTAATGSGGSGVTKTGGVKKPKRSSKKPQASSSTRPSNMNAYSVFMREEMKRLRLEFPGLDHRAALRMAATNWASSRPILGANISLLPNTNTPTNTPQAVQASAVAGESPRRSPTNITVAKQALNPNAASATATAAAATAAAAVVAAMDVSSNAANEGNAGAAAVQGHQFQPVVGSAPGIGNAVQSNIGNAASNHMQHMTITTGVGTSGMAVGVPACIGTVNAEATTATATTTATGTSAEMQLQQGKSASTSNKVLPANATSLAETVQQLLQQVQPLQKPAVMEYDNRGSQQHQSLQTESTMPEAKDGCRHVHTVKPASCVECPSSDWSLNQLALRESSQSHLKSSINVDGPEAKSAIPENREHTLEAQQHGAKSSSGISPATRAIMPQQPPPSSGQDMSDVCYSNRQQPFKHGWTAAALIPLVSLTTWHDVKPPPAAVQCDAPMPTCPRSGNTQVSDHDAMQIQSLPMLMDLLSLQILPTLRKQQQQQQQPCGDNAHASIAAQHAQHGSMIPVNHEMHHQHAQQLFMYSQQGIYSLFQGTDVDQACNSDLRSDLDLDLDLDTDGDDVIGGAQPVGSLDLKRDLGGDHGMMMLMEHMTPGPGSTRPADCGT